jgi:hypothetical protein
VYSGLRNVAQALVLRPGVCVSVPTLWLCDSAPRVAVLCSLGKRSFFTTTDEEQWQLIRKGTAAAFSQANIRCGCGAWTDAARAPAVVEQALCAAAAVSA